MHMARYQRLYGLKALGPHCGRDRLKLTRVCEVCAGTGLLSDDDCHRCHGFGVVYAVSREEFDAWRRGMLAAHPEAEVTDWRPALPFA